MNENGAHKVKLLYFAWLREKVGRTEEDVALPQGVATVADVVAWLKSRGPEFADAFARPEVVRAAVDALHVQHQRLLVMLYVERFFLTEAARALGIDRKLFTPTFAVGRVAGWCAHVAEQRARGRLIRPQSIYVGEAPGESG